ncbi:MAG: hypothetical protein M0036_15330 [Desulfobacteraceae bacterium]|nr:hypothetical protein [Desulfobacteraceae bacterium]
MAKYESIRSNIPLLFRPEPMDTTVLSAFIRSVGALMDDLGRDLGVVMQAHWAGYADDARFNVYVSLDRLKRGLPPLNLTQEEDWMSWETFPHLHDLARIGALLCLRPYRDPKHLSESVEAFRTRLDRYMRLYRNGLGTVQAIRSVVEMELPADPAAPLAQRERSFNIEEFSPLVTMPRAFESRKSAPDNVADAVGPLMRWQFSNDGISPCPTTLYIQAIPQVAGLTDPTRTPCVECYQSADGGLPLAVAFSGVLSPGQTLRLRPAFSSWIGSDAGLLTARSNPVDTLAADPTAPGPWTAAAGAPAAAITALRQTYDRVLWAAVKTEEEEHQLWRYDGIQWQRVIAETTIPAVHCLAERDHQLLVGTDEGLLMIALYPVADDPFAAVAHGDLSVTAVYCLYEDRQGGWWVGTQSGLQRLNPDNSITAVAALSGTAIRAIHQDVGGVFYFGGDLGLFQYQRCAERWAWYHGEEESDQARDWEVLRPGELPREEDIFLPPVRSIHVSPDTSVWIGTETGFARYYAQRVSGATYKTILAAYPDLTMDRVCAIREDDLGLIWFLTANGLFRYDGRDLAQYQAASQRWVGLGRADALYDDEKATNRDAWRFSRGGATWQRFDRYLNQWRSYTAPVRAGEDAAVHCLAWTDSLVAELGVLSAEARSFTPDAGGHPGLDQFVMRVKPSEERIVSGGLPAVPRMPRGASTWRYLSMEEEGMMVSPHRPWWSREGRLFSDTPRNAPFPARHGVRFPTADSHWFGEVVFAYKPAAKLWLEWAPRRLLTTLVRLHKRGVDEAIAPAILDRVWQGIQSVRPAGVRVALAVEREIVRGGEI